MSKAIAKHAVARANVSAWQRFRKDPKDVLKSLLAHKMESDRKIIVERRVAPNRQRYSSTFFLLQPLPLTIAFCSVVSAMLMEHYCDIDTPRAHKK